MTRVVLCTPSMSVGGAERVVVQLAQHLAARGEEVTVAGPAGPLDVELPDAVHRLALRAGGRSPLVMAEGIARMARMLRRERPDVVHAHNPKVAVMAAAAVRAALPRRRPRLVASFHGCRPEEYPRAARLLATTDVIACVSSELAERLAAAGAPASRMLVVPNGIDLPAPLDGERRAALDADLGLAGHPVIAAVGRLEPQKAHERLLAATAVVARRIPELRLLVVGDGSRRAALEAAAARPPLAGTVIFTGRRDDARDLIARADLLVFSSDWEGLSIAALEALAAGVPVVSTPAEGMSELLGTGAGRIAAGWHAEHLGDAVADLLAHPLLRRRMGDEGRRLVGERYSLAGMLDRYDGIYRGA